MPSPTTPTPAREPVDEGPVAPLPAPVVRASAATDLALVATLAAFVVVCSVLPDLGGPSGVPFTLQTFAVVLCGLVLGARRGVAAIALFLVVGLAGVPVFAGHKAGIAVLTGPTGGYLVGFLAAAAVAGALGSLALRRRGTRLAIGLVVAALVASPLVLDAFGIAGLVRYGLSWHAAWVTNLPFVPFDLVKTVLAAIVTLAVLRAFPDVVRARR